MSHQFSQREHKKNGQISISARVICLMMFLSPGRRGTAASRGLEGAEWYIEEKEDVDGEVFNGLL